MATLLPGVAMEAKVATQRFSTQTRAEILQILTRPKEVPRLVKQRMPFLLIHPLKLGVVG
jgi:hypothetical protein